MWFLSLYCIYSALKQWKKKHQRSQNRSEKYSKKYYFGKYYFGIEETLRTVKYLLQQGDLVVEQLKSQIIAVSKKTGQTTKQNNEFKDLHAT